MLVRLTIRVMRDCYKNVIVNKTIRVEHKTQLKREIKSIKAEYRLTYKIGYIYIDSEIIKD